MSEIFLNYLRDERMRLDRELEKASVQPTWAEPGLLQQLRRLVDDQLDRWSEDLSDHTLAA